jgi:hypothetical protein
MVVVLSAVPLRRHDNGAPDIAKAFLWIEGGVLVWQNAKEARGRIAGAGADGG